MWQPYDLYLFTNGEQPWKFQIPVSKKLPEAANQCSVTELACMLRGKHVLRAFQLVHFAHTYKIHKKDHAGWVSEQTQQGFVFLPWVTAFNKIIKDGHEMLIVLFHIVSLYK